MAVDDTATNNNAIAAVAIVVLVALALVAGWAFFLNEGGLDRDRELEIELPGRG